jgi:hypothetical protein
MIKKIAAVVAAAACAGVIVTLAPGLAPEVAAHASPAADRSVPAVAQINKPVDASVANAGGINTNASGSVCEQTWPYYGRACLLGADQTTSNARVVRVIDLSRSDLGRSAALPMRDIKRQSQTRAR